MRIIRFSSLIVLLMIPILFGLGCGNGAMYPVFGTRIDMINGTWELDRKYRNGEYQEIYEESRLTYVFYGDGTGISGIVGDVPSEPNLTWSATEDSIYIDFDNSIRGMNFGYDVDWNELELSIQFLETTPEHPYGTGDYITVRLIYLRRD